MFSNNSKKNTRPKEKTLVELVQIVFRRRNVLIISVVATIVIAVLYNFLATPVYEASGLLKKEVVANEKSQGDFSNIIDLQTRDEIETEMELVNTWNVLSHVIDELKMNINIKSVAPPKGKTVEINQLAVNMEDPEFLNKNSLPIELPEFKSVKIIDKKESGSYFLKKTGTYSFELYDAKTNRLLQTSNIQSSSDLSLTNNSTILSDSSQNKNSSGGIARFDLSIADLEIYWPEAPFGSIVYFDIINYYSAMENLKEQISIERKGKTNVFVVSARSASPFTSALIANTVIDKFRESRIDQQKQTIRYSFKFVDNQLDEMQGKLREAEDNLSKFKASGQITTIDQNSKELIQFLTQLETEKVNTDLQLADYQNKVSEIKSEMSQTGGYVDQSYLSPEGRTDVNTPFSSLLKQLSDLELQRLELLQKRTENHPDVIALDEQIRMAKEKLSSYNQNTLTAYQIIINSLQKKLLKITNLMSKYEVKMEMLPAKENRLARLLRQKNVYEKISTLLLDKREEMRMAELSKLQDITVVDPAHEPLTPVSPRKILNMLIAIILGGFVGLIGVFLLELKDSKLINLDELEEEFNLPIFSIIPSYSNDIKEKIKNSSESKDKFVTLMDEQEGFRETYRLLKTKILFQMEGREKIFMITSCEEDTGKTSIVGNLAVSIAQENKKVLVIDCDLRKAALSRMFDIPKNAPGLIEFIERDVAPTIYTKVLKNIDILPAGGTREDSSHLLNSERMRLLFNAIDTSFYDYIIIDTPPVTRVVDTLVLGRSIKDAVLVVRPGHSFKEAVLGGIQEMLQAKIKLRGIVANGAEVKDSYYYKYRYSYGYGYAYGEKKGPKLSPSSPKKEAKVVQPV
ncbi:polysaccharide biosynthesis tyrosine autokinase [bacterium BMS3Abin03]|nr:polysaccharide biosynthesis tyrosine autokinase [bacterium BMS3Abin03]MCG6959099.1 polysaccharide biosynthesis tyrosine autokinase [bacterium BMS3Abin03]